jgi:hypothetical protein
MLMADYTTPLKTIRNEASGALDRVKGEALDLIDVLDLEPLQQKVRDLGRESPLSLALAAFAVGIASAIAFRRRLHG